MASNLSGLTIKDEHLRRALEGREYLLVDGAMGTQMQERGLDALEAAPELLCKTHAADITAIHAAYIAAGAEVVTTNTFSANRLKLGDKMSVVEAYRLAADCARAAGAPYIAGDIGPTGSLLEPMGTLSFDEAYGIFAEQVRAAVAAGCDIILVETMADLREAKAALLAARENSTLPVFVTMTFGPRYHPRDRGGGPKLARRTGGRSQLLARSCRADWCCARHGVPCALSPYGAAQCRLAPYGKRRDRLRRRSRGVRASNGPSARCRREHRRRLLWNESPIDRAAFKRDCAPREADATRLQACLRSSERPGSGRA